MNLKAIGKKFGLVLAATGVGLMSTPSLASVELAQAPLFLSQPVRPLVMLNMSNDHQLYFKAYDDYSDLTGNGVADTTYVHEHDYYGYFDSRKCYRYRSSNGRFQPTRFVDPDGYCNAGSTSNEWSGNFLNWASMTRIDAVRKILYGGLRVVDTEEVTVLERSFLPQDAHSFAKYYAGSDLPRLTPYNGDLGATNAFARGITMCNTTNPSERQQYSQDVTDPPKMLVAQGNYSLWASNERWQCRWGNYSNDNDPALSGIQAYSRSPANSTNGNYGHKLGEFNVRVEVCVPGLLEEDCRYYPEGNAKPSGLLQEYGEKGELHFGLMTGSYGRNKSGGVLRKNIGDLVNEINVATDGTFKATPTGGGIINALNRLRIYGYDFNEGFYNNSGANGDNCPWAMTSFNDGRCSNWGNPQSEIYLESLRYLAGKTATAGFASNDANYIDGLTTASWADPLSNQNYCAPVNVIQFNASVSSYDNDMGGAADLGVDSVDAWTNNVGAAEGIHGNSFFVGANGDNNDQLCTPKTVGSLSSVHGTCPDAPRLEGTYHIAGLAHYARTNSIRTDLMGEQTVRTYGVTLAPAIPRVIVPVPGSADRTITILPACRNNIQTTRTNCAIVDFKIVEQEFNVNIDGVPTNTGKLYVNWEDSEQGGDFDQDMWGVISYEVTSTNVSVTTQVIAQSTGDPMGFGYVIGGTTTDGFHVHSGVNNFTYTSAYAEYPGCGTTDGTYCTCRVGNGYDGTAGACNHSHSRAQARTQVYTVGTSAAALLEAPLYYAAKWGGYSDDALTTEEIAQGEAETYYAATDPRELQRSLRDAFSHVAERLGSASAVAANSTRVGTDTVIYQALFNSDGWTGEIAAIPLTADGGLAEEPEWKTGANSFAAPQNRKIFTHNGSAGVSFDWNALSDAQRTALVSEQTVRWLRGEAIAGLREPVLLADIVNSDPVFAGSQNHRFHDLPESLGGRTGNSDPYGDYLNDVKRERQEVLYVGANGGMMHAFNAQTGHEMFAYVPSMVYDQLENLTKLTYGMASNAHRYTVDGPLFVGDAYFTHNGVTKWRNILVGTLGAGGRGLFVLDVSDPSTFNENNVLFELTEEDIPEIGNITGRPIVAPTSDGWKIFVGNGYNSDNGQSSLIVVDLSDPKGNSTVVLSTDAVGSNGMAEPELLPDGQGVITHAYAGDLQGRLWKFDLTPAQPGNWTVAFNGQPFFTARDPNGRVQPITAAPVLGRNAQKDNATMVYFGTGSYLTPADNQAGNTVQSFYALADTGIRITSTDRSELMEKSIVSESTSGNGDLDGRSVRQISNNDNTEWWAGASVKRGWYMDLQYNGVITGERVTSKAQLLYDKLLFPTLITSDHPCTMGGSGWLMELIAVGDRYVNHSILGEDGLSLEYAVLGLSSVIQGDGDLYIPVSDISGAIRIEEGSRPPGSYGRMSWRQLR